MSASEASCLPLTEDVIAAHLRGRRHIGLYPLADSHTCWWDAADFDNDTAMLDALAYLKAARAALEVSQSGRGAHVWIFCTAVLAGLAITTAWPGGWRLDPVIGLGRRRRGLAGIPSLARGDDCC